MKRCQKGMLVALCIVLVLAAAPFLLRVISETSPERCFARNEAKLAALAAQFDEGKRTGLVSADLDGVTLMVVHAEPAYLEFHTAAWGIVPASTYYGFYYSPQNIPLPFESDAALQEDGKGWRWQGAGDNQGYTYRIKENWFYFKASY